jgi:hypothetical protein
MPDIKATTTEHEAEESKTFYQSLFKSEGLRIGFAVFSVIFLLFFCAPFLLNNAALKFQLEQKISQISGANVVIHGNLKVAFLPSPTITATDVLLQNYRVKKSENEVEEIYNLYAKAVEIKLVTFKFSNSQFARKIIFTDAILEKHDSAELMLDRKDKFTEAADKFTETSAAEEGKKADFGISAKLFSVKDLSAKSDIPSISVINGEAIIYDHLERKTEIKEINSEIKISADKISSSGSFGSEDVISNFKLSVDLKSQSNSSFEMNSSVMNLRIDGIFSGENRGILGSDFKGKIEAEIFNLKSFYKSYIGGNSVISNKLKYSTDPIKLSADIDSQSKEIALQNLLINSSLIGGKGEIELNFANKIPLIDINLDLENFDLDGIWSGDSVSIPISEKNEITEPECVDELVETVPAEAATEGEKSVIIATADQEKSDEEKAKEAAEAESKKIEPINFNFTQKIKDFDLTAEIKIKNTKYLEGEIKDVDLYLTVSKGGEILVFPMIFRIPGEGTFRVNGVLDNTAEQPKFVGKFDASGKSLKDVLKWLSIESQNLKFDSLQDYALYSDILLSPNKTILDSFYLNLNSNQSEFLGEIHIDNSDKTPNITSKFHVSNFKIDDYFLTSGQNAYLSPGSLLKKLLWLNDISSNNNFEITFDKLIYKDEEFTDQSAKLKFGPGYLSVADLKFNSDETNLSANLSVDISDKNPKFDMSIAANKLHYSTAQKAQPKADQPASEEAKIVAEQPKQQNFFDQFFAFPSLENFRGNILLKFDDLLIDGVAMTDFNMSGKLKDGGFENSELTCTLYGGSLSYKGLIGIKNNKTINGNLSFNNASLQPLLSDLVGIKNVSGVANISTNVTSSSDRKEGFAKNLSSEIKFSANMPIVDGYGLSDLVKKMFSVQTYRNELMEPEKILINPASQTIFKQASGTIQIGDGKGEGRVRINVSAPAINGILSGKINLTNNSSDILFNAIFLTGSRQKQTPINIATSIKGAMNDISQSTNSDQVRQYLGLPKLKTVVEVTAPIDTNPAATLEDTTSTATNPPEKTAENPTPETQPTQAPQAQPAAQPPTQ